MRTQDPYSLRCQPQVMGACLDQLNFCRQQIMLEANAVSDNPLVFSQQNDILTGGNFHAQAVAMAADNMALAITEIGSMAERRIAFMMDDSMSGLPSFLVEDSGINSGFMLAQTTAAALVSENKQLASPASVDSIPTSANQEDHVSMATYAARRLLMMLDNTASIVAIELICAAQAVQLKPGLKLPAALAEVIELVTTEVPFLKTDRVLSANIESVKEIILNGKVGYKFYL